MYKQTVQLAPGENLQLDWGKNYADFRIALNGQPVGYFPDKASLKLGNRFQLPGEGQRQITVLLSDQGLEVWLNGVEIVSGIRSGEADYFTNATRYLLVFGILQASSALFFAIFGGDWHTNHAVAVGLISLVGLVLIGLSVQAKRSGEVLPLRIAQGLLALDIVLGLFIGRIPGLLIIVLMMASLQKGINAGAVKKPQRQELQEDGPLDVGL